MTDAISTTLQNVASFVPQLLLFLVILLIGWIIAKVVAKVMTKLLEKINFERLADKGGLSRFLGGSSWTISDIVVKLVYYFIMLFVLQLAFAAFGPNPLSSLIDQLVAFLPQAFVAVVIIVVVFAIASAVRDLLTGMLGQRSYTKAVSNIAYFAIIALGVIAALNQMGIATTVTMPVLITALATIAGILIVGVGGGLIRPMQGRWEGYLSKAEAEAGPAPAADAPPRPQSGGQVPPAPGGPGPR